MPTRRLPKSDEQRNDALTAAKKRKDVTLPAEMVLTPNTAIRLDALQPVFHEKMRLRGLALKEQSNLTFQVEETKNTCRMYISHFIQSFNNGVDRGMFPASDRAHYQLDVSSNSVPSLKSEADILRWGQRLIDGDADRVAAGGKKMSMPTIIQLTNVFNDFNDINLQQSLKKEAYDRAQEEVSGMRTEADKLTLRIWDEVETAFTEEDPSSKRRKAREWGVVYITSPGEEPEPGEEAYILTSDQSIFQTFELGLNGLGDFIIRWKDGNIDNLTLDNSTQFINHDYTIPGEYDVEIEGDPSKITEIHSNNSRLIAVLLPLLASNIQELILQNNMLPASMVDYILTTINGFGTSGGVISLIGNASPTAAGLAAKAELESRGWTVLVA